MKKRIFSVLLVAVMLFSLAACGNSTPNATNATTAAETEAVATETAATEAAATEASEKISAEGLGGYKIGFWYTPPTDPLSKGFRDTLDYCAKITNCEMVYYDMTAWDAGSQSAAVESLVSQGCDAIIMVVGSSPATFQYLNDNKVYYVGMTRSYTPEVAKVADTSEYCTGWMGDLGGVGGGNYKTGYDLTKTLADAGCKNIAFFDASEGEKMADERAEGVNAAVKETGMTLVTSYRGNQWATGFSDVLATFGSKLDGIVYPGGSGDMAVAAIQTAGYLGKIKIAQGNSAGDDTRDYIDQGILTVTSVGGTSFMLQMYMQLFNALSGADKLFSTGNKLFPTMPALMVTNVADYDTALSIYTDMPVGMTANDILKLNSKAAPGMTVAEREELMKYYCSTDYLNVKTLRAKADENKK